MSVADTVETTAAGPEFWTDDETSIAVQDLLGIAADAARFFPPLYLSAIFGHPWTWVPPYHQYSEFRMLDVWQPLRAMRYIINATLPSAPRTPPPIGPPLLNRFFWQPTVILQRPDHVGSYTSYPDEHWFFVNGILTNDAVAQLNAAFLAELFHRPITVVQNATGSLAADLLECALGKQWHRTTEAVVKAFPVIYDALVSGKRKVVVIAHSQGTIVVASVLRLLSVLSRRARALRLVGARGEAFEAPVFVYPSDAPLDLSDFDPISEDHLAKLEVYCFANCATTMAYWRRPTPGVRPIPWIENLGNEFDLVARLGMLAPYPVERQIEIAGPIFRRPGAWGHLLNEHYLAPIDAHQRHGRRRGGQGGCAPYELANGAAFPDVVAPRLFRYINGGSPED